MLVYEKRVKHSLELEILEDDSTASPRTEIREFETLNFTMPASIYQSVLADNDKYLLQKNTYNADFFAFLLETINSAIAAAINISEIALPLVFNILCRCSHNKLLPDLIIALKKLFELFPANIEKFIRTQLEDHLQNCKSLLLVCPTKATRKAFSDFVIFCLVKQSTMDFSENCDAKVFISSLLAAIPQEIGGHCRCFQQFWKLFRDFALTGEAQSVFLLNSGVISIFIDFYLAEKSQLLHQEERTGMGTEVWAPLIHTLAVVSQYCSTVTGVRSYDLSDLDKKCLFDSRFYKKALVSIKNDKYLSMIIEHFCKEDLKLSEKIAKLLLETLKDRHTGENLAIISAFLRVDDSYVQFRIEWVLGVPRVLGLFIPETGPPYLPDPCPPCTDEGLHSYPSSLDILNSLNGREGILALILKCQKAGDLQFLVYARQLLTMFVLSDHLAGYAKTLPPPTSKCLSFMHWLGICIWGAHSKHCHGAKEAYQAMLLFIERYELASQGTSVVTETGDARIRSEAVKDKITLRITEYNNQSSGSSHGEKASKALMNKSAKYDQTVGRSVEITHKAFNPSTVNDEDTAESMQDLQESVENWVQGDFTHARIEVINSDSRTVRVWMQFTKNLNQNFWCPSSVITVEVSSQTREDLIVLTKIVPENSWPEIDFEWGVDYEEGKKSGEQLGDTGVQKYSNDSDVNFSEDTTRERLAQMCCPGCIGFNDPKNILYDICEGNLEKEDRAW